MEGKQRVESRKHKVESTKHKAQNRKQKAQSKKQKAESRKQKAESVKLHLLKRLFLLSAFCFLLSHCTTKTDKATESTPKFTQYYNQGEKLYEKNCSNCHQKDGTGLGRVYPPLYKSDYMSNNFNEVICLIHFGKKEDLTVNGTSFNQTMPGIPTLTDLEIAEIATYIYNSWEHQRGIVEVKDVSEILKKCEQAP